jgi:hypothetical protein
MHHPDAEVKSTFAYVPAGNGHGRAHTASGEWLFDRRRSRSSATAPLSTIYYGFPEGPTASVNKLNARGNGQQEKEQIALSNGDQELLHKVFPTMNVVHRNSLTPQELIMQEAVTADRINDQSTRTKTACGCRRRLSANCSCKHSRPTSS